MSRTNNTAVQDATSAKSSAKKFNSESVSPIELRMFDNAVHIRLTGNVDKNGFALAGTLETLTDGTFVLISPDNERCSNPQEKQQKALFYGLLPGLRREASRLFPSDTERVTREKYDSVTAERDSAAQTLAIVGYALRGEFDAIDMDVYESRRTDVAAILDSATINAIDNALLERDSN